MSELSPTIVSNVLAACQAGASEAGAALSRALDAEFTLTVGEPGTLSPNALPEELNTPGLAVVLTIGASGAVLVLPESTELLPDWYADPDPTGQSKLTTLAQELGSCLLPDDYLPESYKTARVVNLTEALKRGGLIEGAAMASLMLKTKDGKQGTALLVWPVSKPDKVIGAVSVKKETPSKSTASAPSNLKAESASKPIANPTYGRKVKREFPPYTRSLLRVRVPVVVTLAEKKQTLGRILDIGPGQIIQFDKSCEEALDLESNNCKIASGEAIKVGDKFGLRITSIIPPEERFLPVRPEK